MGWSRSQFIRLTIVLCVLLAACSGGPPSEARSGHEVERRLASTPFDAQRAFDHVRRLVEMGPRPVGTPAHDRARDYIIDQLKGWQLQVERDDFTADTPLGQRAMTNIIGKLSGRTQDVILIASHYDTKLFTDFSFVGANDGGSSTGAALEIARVLAGQPAEMRPQVWVVFFDGEEAFIRWSQTDSKYGSRHLAEKWQKDGTLSRIRALILLDMIGDKNLDLKRDGYSTRSLVDVIWQTAGQLDYRQHFLPQMTYIDDDHEPFLRVGVPAVDLIDFNYGPNNSYWHKPEDTLDKLDPMSLKIVGDVVIRALPTIVTTMARRGR